MWLKTEATAAGVFVSRDAGKSTRSQLGHPEPSTGERRPALLRTFTAVHQDWTQTFTHSEFLFFITDTDELKGHVLFDLSR